MSCYPAGSACGTSTDAYRFREIDELNPVCTCCAGRLRPGHCPLDAGRAGGVCFLFLIAPSLVPVLPQFCGRIADDLRNGRTVEMFSDSYSSALCLVASELATWPAERQDLTELPSVISVCDDRALSKYETRLMIADRL